MSDIPVPPNKKRVRITPFIGQMVVFWRTLLGLTQEELAKRAGVSLSTLKKIEAGRKHGPWFGTLEDLCEAMDICLQELIAGAGRLAAQRQG
ncbi:MAG TPA: hypothetical protein DDZ88_21495 [Verrucomicrobiales bacterium]|nr:hypothetical protein [Verrucomicrobiales bacterium]